MKKLEDWEIKNMFVEETGEYYPNNKNYKYTEWLEKKIISLLFLK